ncbi:DUF6318 family protein [Janibacter sp. YB324]|uniref:DUF6318 family protein n=1 Tax=Janibacter sp. YB324 TaxID=2761047 RepID=UPI0016273E2B|nr:DUF6318 family protein [Janibacter sp. YB324]QNF95330.1 hypothetical protein H7A72_06055 [Janibacter sp. YB324]
MAILTGGLAACGDNSEPQESTTTASPIDRSTDSTSSSESSSSSGSETSFPSGEGKVAELPEEAKAKTKEGAIAFNEFFEMQMGEALKTGDTATIEEFSANCAPCDEYVRLTKADAEKGIHMNVNPNKVRDVAATKRQDGGYRVTLTVDASEYHEIKADGSPGRTAEAVTYKLATNTQWSDGHWVIRNTVRVQ